MKKLFTLLSFLGIALFASAQLQLDKQMQMTGGTDSDRRITNLGDPAGASDAVNVKTIQAGTLLFDETTGSGGNYVVNLNPNPASYTMGMIVHFKANHNNGGNATLKVGSLAAIGIKKGVIDTLSANDIVDDQLVSVMFDGTNFQLLSGIPSPASVPPSGTAGGDLTGTYPNPDIAANAVTTTEILDGTIAPVDLAAGSATGQVLKWNGSAWQLDDDESNAGTVTSVGLSLPGIFNVSGSPVMASGTLTGALANQSANAVFAGPASGGAAAPAFRSLVAADVPDLSAGYVKNQASLQSASEFHISGTGRTSTAFQSPVYTRADAGTVAIRPNANSATAVQLQDAAGASILNLDAVNQSVGIGTTGNSASAKLDVVNPSGLGRIRVSGVQTGYTQADVLLQTGTTHNPEGRGTGIYTQNQGNNTTWYFGNPYSSPDMFVINRKAGTGLLSETAQNNATGVSNVLSITGAGNVGIGTSGSANKLNVVNSTLSGGTAGMIAINSTYTVDQPPADIRAAIAGIGHYTTTPNVRSAGVYGWVPTGGHGTLASAAIFDRPDNNRRIFIGGWQTTINTPSIHVYNTSTTGTDFIVDNTGKVGIGTVSPSTSLQVNGTVTATALAGAFDQSPSGYVRMGNMQIAWGTTVLASGQGWTSGGGSTRYVLCSQNITFPAAFLIAPTVTFGMIDGAIAARSAYVSYFLPTTTNVNTIYLTSPITHFETSAVTVHWTAIGRWQ